jgi:hypothetical protein
LVEIVDAGCCRKIEGDRESGKDAVNHGIGRGVVKADKWSK